jgi:hypothetical protein
MNYNTYLNSLANTFQQAILSEPTARYIPTEDFGWTNHRYESDWFRLAHIERYTDTKIEVLHVTTFPHRWSPEPIFGFDVICTNNQVVGAYMDLSPTSKVYEFDKGISFEERKPLPEWATVFSDNFILLKPKDVEEFERFCTWVAQKYQWYLHLLTDGDVASSDEELAITEKQNTYCEIQAQNPRTYSVLKTKLGEERASYFMQKILFPKISY